MYFAATLKILGILMMMFSLSMVPPIFVALWYHDGALQPFIFSFFITFFTGLCLWASTYSARQELKTRDGFLVVVLFWTVLSFFGSIPFMMDPVHKLSFIDAIFESVSGLTTTGATVLSDLQKLPHSILYYRQQLEFLGGMGIIVLAVAILPMLGVGGMQLCRAETAGPIKNTKLKPRMKETAKALWSIYVGLTVCCAFGYWLAGMDLFDAISESFGTVSTGGFSTHDESLGFYNSQAVNLIAVVFMFLGALNFALHFQFMQNKKLSTYFKDPELRTYVGLLLLAVLITTLTLMLLHTYQDPLEGFLKSLFMVVSMSSTTGAFTMDANDWPTFIPYLMMFIAIVGGCAASTSGGLKMIRLMIVRAQGTRELDRLIHPRAVLPIKLGGHTVPENVIQAIWGFVSVFSTLFAFLILILLALGLDFKTAFGALAACLSNTGTGIGEVAINFVNISYASKWVLVFAMLAGRLEIFTLMVLFMPSYWKR